MSENEKKTIGVIAAIIVAIILWLLFAKKDKIKKLLQDNGFTMPQISLPPVPDYELADFSNLDGCKMCMNGNYSVILPASQPKVIPDYVPPTEIAKAIAYPRTAPPRYNQMTTKVVPAKPKPWWV